jgi:hypothetical protein
MGTLSTKNLKRNRITHMATTSIISRKKLQSQALRPLGLVNTDPNFA